MIVGYMISFAVKPSVDCEWSAWASYASCSKSCGGGTKQRQRYKSVQESNGGTCHGLNEDTISCNTQNCPGKFTIFHEEKY